MKKPMHARYLASLPLSVPLALLPQAHAAAPAKASSMQQIGTPVNQAAVSSQRWTRIGNCGDVVPPAH
jgi:hypothetical protein